MVAALPSRARWLGVCLLGCAPLIALGQQVPQGSTTDPADRIFREQAERERARVLQRSDAAANIQLPSPALAQEQGFPEGLAVSGPAFLVRSIQPSGDALLDPQVWARITAPFAQRTLAAAHIQVLLERLNAALVAAGTITSRAYVGPQNLADGELVISFMAGRIERVLLDGRDLFEPGGPDAGVRGALPFAIGDVLRLPDVEQAVDQLNRVRGNQIQVQIQPGQGVGASIIDLRNQGSAARQISLTLDNQGSASSGRWRTQLGVEQGNALGLMDTLALGLTTSRDTNALYATVSVPWGYNTVSLMGSWSEYQNLIGDTALVYGTSNNISLAFNRIIARDQTSKTAVDFTLARRASNRAINNAELTPQVLVVARAGVNRLTRSASGAQWTLDAAWVQGLAAMDALHDAPDLPTGAARAQFRKIEFSASAQTTLPFAALSGWTWRTRANAQWSPDALYASEQILAGGVSSVRGFAESAVSADRGIVWRNELAREGLFAFADGKARVDAYVYCDMAHLNTALDTGGSQLSSVGAGLRIPFLWRTTQGVWDLIVGVPVRYPDSLPDTGPRLNLSLNLLF